ncbi:unnamed protein product [Lota lota]
MRLIVVRDLSFLQLVAGRRNLAENHENHEPWTSSSPGFCPPSHPAHPSASKLGPLHLRTSTCRTDMSRHSAEALTHGDLKVSPGGAEAPAEPLVQQARGSCPGRRAD